MGENCRRQSKQMVPSTDPAPTRPQIEQTGGRKKSRKRLNTGFKGSRGQSSYAKASEDMGSSLRNIRQFQISKSKCQTKLNKSEVYARKTEAEIAEKIEESELNIFRD